MRKLILFFALTTILFAVSCSCGQENKPELNQQEQKAVETQVEKDQAAMDSLEKAIEAQIKGTDTIK